MKGFRNREIPVLYKNAGGVSVIDTGVFVRHKIMKPTLTYSHGQRPWDSKLLRQRTFLPLNWLVLNQGRAIGPSQGRPYRPLGTGAVTTPVRHQGYSSSRQDPCGSDSRRNIVKFCPWLCSSSHSADRTGWCIWDQHILTGSLPAPPCTR